MTPNTQAQNNFLKEPDQDQYGESVVKTPKIVFFVYFLIFAYGFIWSHFFGTHFWEMYLWYAAGVGSFFIWHILAHQKWTGLMVLFFSTNFFSINFTWNIILLFIHQDTFLVIQN